MKKITTCFIIALLLITTAYSCKGDMNANVDKSKMPVVSVKGKTLYRSDLESILPLGLSGEDSVAAARAYIDTWAGDQLMYDKARLNLLNKSDIDALVEDYRESLIVNSYQEQLLKENFSKSVSENDLKAYYEQNKSKFTLDNNLIKGLYLKIPVGSSQRDNFLKWYKQGTEAAVENIEKNTSLNAVGYEYFYDRWVDLDEIVGNIPANISDQKQFLKANKNLEVRDSSFIYLLNIKEYILSGNDAPYDYIKGNLTEIFIEQRKSNYLKQVRKDLFDKAVSDDEIKFYDK